MVSLGNMERWAISHRVILILLGIILIGSLLRIYHLGTESIWYDEAASIDGSKESVVSVIESSGRLHNVPPLYYVLLHFWMLLFGTGEIAVRSLSAIFGIISIFVIYKVGCQLFNRKVGLISSFLSAISCYHIYFSQEARAYSLLQLLTLLSFSFFIKIVKTDNKRKLYFALLLLTNVCLAYTHPYGLLVIVSQIVYFLFLWSEYKRLRFWFLGVQVATVAFFSPWIPTFFGRVSQKITEGFWIDKPSLKHIFQTFIDYSSGDSGGLSGLSSILLLVFSILCLIGLISIKRRNGGWNPRKPLQSVKGLSWNISPEFVEEILLLLMWFSFPIFIPFIVSQFSTPIYTTRYTISASAAFYLLVAKGISAFTSRKALFFVVILVSLLSLPGLQHYYSHYKKGQWREITGFIEHNTRAKDVIIIWPDYYQLPFNYYYKGNLERFGIPEVQDTKEIAGFVHGATVGKERLWLVVLNFRRKASASFKDSLVDRVGSGSIVREKKGFDAYEVYLFDLHVDSP
jgi:mannosyltransferase